MELFWLLMADFKVCRCFVEVRYWRKMRCEFRSCYLYIYPFLSLPRIFRVLRTKVGFYLITMLKPGFIPKPWFFWTFFYLLNRIEDVPQEAHIHHEKKHFHLLDGSQSQLDVPNDNEVMCHNRHPNTMKNSKWHDSTLITVGCDKWSWSDVRISLIYNVFECVWSSHSTQPWIRCIACLQPFHRPGSSVF